MVDNATQNCATDLLYKVAVGEGEPEELLATNILNGFMVSYVEAGYRNQAHVVLESRTLWKCRAWSAAGKEIV